MAVQMNTLDYSGLLLVMILLSLVMVTARRLRGCRWPSLAATTTTGLLSHWPWEVGYLNLPNGRRCNAADSPSQTRLEHLIFWL